MSGMRPRQRRPDSRAYWDRAAQQRPAWFIATEFSDLDEAFFARGAQEVDELLAHCGVSIASTHTVLEIGCGAGRMTHRLAELAERVIALDVSPKMLQLAEEHVAADNIDFVLGSGHDLAGIEDASVDLVFSYVTLQHVPTREAQLSYLREAARVLRPGAAAALQIRASGPKAVVVDVAGQVGRALQGKPTLAHEWRGARLSERAVRRAVTAPDVSCALVPRGSRHRWVVLRRQP